MRFLNHKDLKRNFGKENVSKFNDFSLVEINDFVYAISRDVAKINLEDFNVRSMGLRVGMIIDGKLRLTENGERFFKMRKISFS